MVDEVVEIRLGEKGSWQVRIGSNEIALVRNNYFVAHYLRDCPATMELLQKGFAIMLKEIADYLGLTMQELGLIPLFSSP